MSDNISKTIQQYKDMVQLQLYASAQEQTILNMSKKIKKLEEERDHLKKVADGSVPIIKSTDSKITEIFENDSEYICHMEIAKLKEVSTERELTLEECRKLETYYRIVSQIDNKKQKPEKEVEKVKTEDLLKLVEGNGTIKQ